MTLRRRVVRLSRSPLGAAVPTVAVGLVLAVVGAVVAGPSAAGGALVATALVVGFFATGAAPLLVQPRPGDRGPGLLVVLVTYAFRLVLALVVMTLAIASGAADREWAGLSVIGLSLAWTATQVARVLTARVPL